MESMRTEHEAKQALDAHGDIVRRICFLHLKNYTDVEDVFQEVFLKYILYEHSFESHTHERAWLLRVAINQCKDLLKSFFRKRVTSIDDVDISSFDTLDEDKEVLNAVLQLPEKYRDVVYLHYYEGYSAVEIAKMLDKKENTIYTWMMRAREQLKKSLGGGESFD